MTEDLTAENQILKSYNEGFEVLVQAELKRIYELEAKLREVKRLVDTRFRAYTSVEETDFLLVLSDKLKD